MHRFRWTDAQHDSQNFRITSPLSKGWMEAGPADLNEQKVHPRRKRDRVNEGSVLAGCIIIRSGDSRMLPRIQTRHGLAEVNAAEVRVRIVIPVSTPKAGIY